MENIFNEEKNQDEEFLLRETPKQKKKFLLKSFFPAIFLAISFFLFGVHFSVYTTPLFFDIVNVSGKEIQKSSEIDLSVFWKVWNVLNERYPESSISDREKVFGAINGLVDSFGDPYTVFLDPKEKKLFEDDVLRGNFGGVGMEIGIREKMLTVIAPMKNTPAEKAGVKAGDKILKIDDKIVTPDMSVEEAISLIRGKPGTLVTLALLREGMENSIDVKIKRATITLPTLEAELRSDKIFVIKLYSFSANSVDLFKKAMKKFIATKSDKLVIDLRGNPGGYLESAVDIASWFVEGGKTVVVEDYGSARKPVVFKSKGHTGLPATLKIAILMDKGSASASEILAGALRDYKKAVLVGEKSFGKGSVQEVIPITSDTLLKVTVAKWLTPNGNSITEKGLTPDYEIKNTEKDKDASKKDLAMEKAVDLLKIWPILK